MKALFFAYAWVLLAAGMIMTGVAALEFYNLQSWITPKTAQIQTTDEKMVLAGNNSQLDETRQERAVEAIAEAADARAVIVANFLKRHNSPLKPYDYFGEKLVEIADRHQIDFRLLPAIAMQESNLCKVIPHNSYNCLGFGVHSQGTLRFESYEANFERAAREIKANYIDIGLTTPEEIMTKYTPHSDGSWAFSVNQWMAEMRYDDYRLGKERKTDANLLELLEENK